MAADPIVAVCSDASATTVEIDIDGAPISDSNPMPVDVVAGSISIDPGDIEIGAVEIKSATNDNRAEVDLPANLTGVDLVLGVHDPLGATATAQATGNASLAAIDAGTPAALGQTTMAAAQPVVIASDQTSVAVNDPGLPDTLGAKTSANSTSVVLASDQATVPVNDPGLPDTLGQKTMANSTGVVIASDQSTLPVNDPGLPDTLGQKTAANSTSVVLASDQGSVPVAGTAADGAAVSGNPVRVGGKDGSGNTQDVVTDTSGNLTSVGNVASGVADAGAPVKVGAVFNTVLPTIANGQRGDAQIDAAARLIVTLGTLIGGEDLTNALMGVLMKPVASATYSPSNNKDAGTVTKANAKASAGNVYSFRVTNANAAVRYFQLHDKASAPAAAETASRFFLIPAGTAAQPAVVEIPSTYLAPSWRLGTGVSWAISTTAAVFTDAATAAEHTVDLSYV